MSTVQQSLLDRQREIENIKKHMASKKRGKTYKDLRELREEVRQKAERKRRLAEFATSEFSASIPDSGDPFGFQSPPSSPRVRASRLLVRTITPIDLGETAAATQRGKTGEKKGKHKGGRSVFFA